MPLVQITMLQGRTVDQKRKIAQRITDAMVEEAGARREGIVVTFLEVSKESYASGGELMADKQHKKRRAPCRQRRGTPAALLCQPSQARVPAPQLSQRFV